MIRILVFFIEVDSNYPYETKEKTKVFPFCAKDKTSLRDKFSIHMNEVKPNNYTQKKI